METAAASSSVFMHPQVIAALIGAAALVVTALIAAIVAIRNTNKTAAAAIAAANAQAAAATAKAAAADAQAAATAKASVEVAAKTAAYEVSEYEAVTTIFDDGSGVHVRTWKELRVTQFIQNLKIPCDFGFSPGAKSARPEAHALKGSALSAHFEVTSETDTKIEGYVVIEGFVTPETGWVAFTVQQRFTGGFSRTREEALQKYRNDEVKQEYVSSSVTVPSKKLVRQIIFPDSYRGRIAPPQALVFIGDKGEVIDQLETARVQANLNVVDNAASLVVQPPKVGKRYAISWMPPDRQAP